MADFQLVGNIAGAVGATVRLTVTYLSDYRDEQGRVPPPVMQFSKLPGQEWTAQPGGGAAFLIGALAGALPPRVTVAYTLIRAGLPPLAKVLERYVSGNTQPAGYWDFTLPGSASGAAPTAPTQINVLPGTGPAGPRGAAFLHGQGAPVAGLGLDGDSYINALTWDVSVRSGGQWVAAGNIKGGRGAPGDDGLPGLNGAGGVPRPTADQVGFVLVADETQPNGFSWYAQSKLRLRALGDVSISGITNGQTLVWSAAEAKFKPGAGGGSLDAEAVQDLVAAMLVPGQSIDLTYDDVAGQLLISANDGYVMPAAPPAPSPVTPPGFTNVNLGADWGESQQFPGTYQTINSAALPSELDFNTTFLKAGQIATVRTRFQSGDSRSLQFTLYNQTTQQVEGNPILLSRADNGQARTLTVQNDGVHILTFVAVGSAPSPVTLIQVYEVAVVYALPVPVSDPQGNGFPQAVYGEFPKGQWRYLPQNLPSNASYHFTLTERSALRVKSQNSGFTLNRGGTEYPYFTPSGNEGNQETVLRGYAPGDYYLITHDPPSDPSLQRWLYLDWQADPLAAGGAGPKGDRGDPGLSAYQIWLSAGHTGTETQYLASLEGDKGDKGDKGDTGARGPAGPPGSSGGSVDPSLIRDIPLPGTVHDFGTFASGSVAGQHGWLSTSAQQIVGGQLVLNNTFGGDGLGVQVPGRFAEGEVLLEVDPAAPYPLIRLNRNAGGQSFAAWLYNASGVSVDCGVLSDGAVIVSNGGGGGKTVAGTTGLILLRAVLERYTLSVWAWHKDIPMPAAPQWSMDVSAYPLGEGDVYLSMTGGTSRLNSLTVQNGTSPPNAEQVQADFQGRWWTAYRAGLQGMATISQGSEFLTRTTGSDLRAQIYRDPATTQRPTFAVSVGGAAAALVPGPVTSGWSEILLATGLSGVSDVSVILDGLHELDPVWDGAALLVGNLASTGGTTVPITDPLQPIWRQRGDSITAGVLARGSGSGTAPDRSAGSLTYGRVAARLAGVRVVQAGYGGTRLAAAGAGSGGVPGLLANDLAYHARHPEAPDGAVDILSTCIGTNDASAGVSPASFQADYSALITRDVARHPNAKLLYLVPPSGVYAAQIQAAVTAAGNARVTLSNQSGNAYPTTDGTHPSVAGHAAWGADLAPAIIALIGGAAYVTPPYQPQGTGNSALPAGGTSGQVLTKLSAAAGDAAWQNPPSGAVGVFGRVTSHTTQNISGGWTQATTLDDVTASASGAMQANQFVCPMAGVYSVKARAAFFNIVAGQNCGLAIKRNGNFVTVGTSAAGGGTFTSFIADDLVLAAGDILTVWISSSAAASTYGNNDADYTTLSVVHLP